MPRNSTEICKTKYLSINRFVSTNNIYDKAWLIHLMEAESNTILSENTLSFIYNLYQISTVHFKAAVSDRKCKFIHRKLRIRMFVVAQPSSCCVPSCEKQPSWLLKYERISIAMGNMKVATLNTEIIWIDNWNFVFKELFWISII